MSLRPPLGVDLHQTNTFLQVLAPNEDRHYFRTFPDGGGGRGHNYYGTLDEVATNLQLDNGKGYGVFVVVNAGGQKAHDINRIRAVWADFDGTALPQALPLPPHIIVESSPSKYHVYWMVDGLPIDQFTAVQRGIAGMLGSDPSVSDLSRVMRLPGFIHHKGEPFQVKLKRPDPGAMEVSA